MKKILSLCLVAVLMLTVFAGCGNNAGSGNKDLPAFTYMYNTTALHEAVAQVFQDSWKKLGFDVNVQSQEWAVFQTSRTEGNYTVCRHGWLGDYADPMTMLDLFLSYSDQNDPNFKNEEYDKYIQAAKSSKDQAERMDAMHKAEKLLIDSYYVIPIFYYDDPRLDNGKVTDAVHDMLLNHLNFKWASKSDGSDIIYALGATPKSLDPALNNATDGASIIQQCFDGLTLKNKDYQIEPGIAESWEVSEDGLTWVFHLRDANWSDGVPVTADDFVYAWKRACDPATAAEYAYQMEYIENAHEIVMGEKDPDTLNVKAIDAKTLEVKLAAPCGYFTEMVAFPTYYPVRKDVIEANPGWANEPATYICNGAYKITQFTQQDKLVMQKNDAYWNAANTPCPTVINYLSDDDAAMMNAFEAGEVDIVEGVVPEEVDRLKAAGVFFTEPSVGTYYVSVNADAPEMQDIAVRKALALSIDRDYVTSVAQQGIPAYAFVPPGLMDVDGKEFRAVGGERMFGSGDAAKDLEEAKKILRDAGYTVAK